MNDYRIIAGNVYSCNTQILDEEKRKGDQNMHQTIGTWLLNCFIVLLLEQEHINEHTHYDMPVISMSLLVFQADIIAKDLALGDF